MKRLRDSTFRIRRFSQSIDSRRIRGIAALEVVLILPIVAMIWLFIVWLARWFTTSSEVIIEARRDVWSQRDKQADSAKPFVFSNLNPTTARAQREAKVGVFHGTPEASQTLLVGAWDFRSVPLDHQVHWEYDRLLMGKAASGRWQQIEGGKSQFQDLFSGFFDPEQTATKVSGGEYAQIRQFVDSLTGQMQRNSNQHAQGAKDSLAQKKEDLSGLKQQLQQATMNRQLQSKQKDDILKTLMTDKSLTTAQKTAYNTQVDLLTASLKTLDMQIGVLQEKVTAETTNVNGLEQTINTVP